MDIRTSDGHVLTIPDNLVNQIPHLVALKDCDGPIEFEDMDGSYITSVQFTKAIWDTIISWHTTMAKYTELEAAFDAKKDTLTKDNFDELADEQQAYYDLKNNKIDELIKDQFHMHAVIKCVHFMGYEAMDCVKDRYIDQYFVNKEPQEYWDSFLPIHNDTWKGSHEQWMEVYRVARKVPMKIPEAFQDAINEEVKAVNDITMVNEELEKAKKDYETTLNEVDKSEKELADGTNDNAEKELEVAKEMLVSMKEHYDETKEAHPEKIKKAQAAQEKAVAATLEFIKTL